MVRTDKSNEFRTALSISPFIFGEFQKGYVYHAGGLRADTPEALQNVYIAAGATEMFARIATKRKATGENPQDINEDIHTLEQGLALCRIAAKLNIPINPEIMCARTYMDGFIQQAPDFFEYPEIYELQKGKKWDQLTLDEMCRVLEAYGEYIGKEIYRTGCRVENFNLGNEANFGFAGLSVGLNTAVEPKLKKISSINGYIYSIFYPSWLKKFLWERQAALFISLRSGLQKSFPNAKYSTHITLITATSALMQFQSWIKQGYDLHEPGLSFYPSGPGAVKDRMMLLERTVRMVADRTGKRIFLAEFAYPSSKSMQHPYKDWVRVVDGYPLSEEGHAKMYLKLAGWGREIGLSGIRYWAPDFSEWGSMPLFHFAAEGKTASGKLLLEELIKRNMTPV